MGLWYQAECDLKEKSEYEELYDKFWILLFCKSLALGGVWL